MASIWQSRPRVNTERTLTDFVRAQLTGSRFAHFFILACGGVLVGALHALAHAGWINAAGPGETVIGAGIAGLFVAAYVSLYGEHLLVRVAGVSLYMPALGLLLVAGAAPDDAASHSERLSLFLLFPLVSATLTVHGVALVAVAISSGAFLLHHFDAHPQAHSLLLWVQWGLAITFGAVLRHFRLRLAMHSHLRRVELQSRVRTDALTGLNNRTGWNELAPGVLTEARRRGRPACVLFFDVDRFKLVNDAYGHDMGDRVLQQLANLIVQLRPARSVVARMGGEEFVAITAPGTLDESIAYAQRVRGQFSQLERSRGVTVSIGVAQVKPGESLSDAMKRADRALYRAKDEGRNRVEIAPAS